MLNKKEKEIIKELENIIIEIQGATNRDESRLCSIVSALFDLRSRGVETARHSITVMKFNDKKHN